MMRTRQLMQVLATAGVLLLGACASQPQRAGAGAPASTQDQLVYPELPEFEPPAAQNHVLANGLRVMLIPDRSLPLVQARLVWPGGGFGDPEGKSGLAELVGASLRSGGTASLTPQQLDAWLEDRAASIETGISGMTGSASMNALAADLGPMLELLSDVIFEPGFDAERVEIERRALLGEIARQNDQPKGIISREFTQLIYGEDADPARVPRGSEVGAITIDDMRAFHAANVQPGGMILGITGDFDSAQALEWVSAAFAKRKGDRAMTLPEVDLGEAPAAGVRFILREDVTQSNIVIGHRGITRDDPDFHAISVLNEIFGGGSSSRLFRHIRSEQGLGYDPAGGMGHAWGYPGLFSVSVSTRSNATGEAIAALLAEIERLRTEPPTAAEVERARTNILNSFVFNADTAGKVLSQQIHYAIHGFPADTLSAYRRGIEAVSVEDVQRAVERIDPDALAIMVLAASPQTQPPLESFGPVSEIDISIQP